jgi:tetratricopeptide (TPR) repeat protein
VYDGHFRIAMAAALSLAQKSRNLRAAKRFEEALTTAQSAIAADADCLQAQIALGDALTGLQRRDEARIAYQRALAKAQSLDPEVQDRWVPGIERRLGGR